MSNQKLLTVQRDKLWSNLCFSDERFNDSHSFYNHCCQKLICEANWLYNSLSQWNSAHQQNCLYETAHWLWEQNKSSIDLSAQSRSVWSKTVCQNMIWHSHKTAEAARLHSQSMRHWLVIIYYYYYSIEVYAV